MQNNDQQQEKLCKIISVGPPNAGKTSLLTRLTRNQFQDAYVATIGVDFAVKRVIVDNQIMKLQIWDTAGQERFRTAISKAYYRGAHGVFLTFDISEEGSFQEMQRYHDQLKEEIKNMNVNIQFLLVGCKSDLESKRQVSYDVALAFAQSQGMHYIETSAKMNTNCLEVADYIAREILTAMKNNEVEIQQVELKKADEPLQKKSTCC